MTTDVNLWQLGDFDECTCSDYRFQHLNGSGKCKIPDSLPKDLEPCPWFDLWDSATEIPEPYVSWNRVKMTGG